jgi:hypothetical protein
MPWGPCVTPWSLEVRGRRRGSSSCFLAPARPGLTSAEGYNVSMSKRTVIVRIDGTNDGRLVCAAQGTVAVMPPRPKADGRPPPGPLSLRPSSGISRLAPGLHTVSTHPPRGLHTGSRSIDTARHPGAGAIHQCRASGADWAGAPPIARPNPHARPSSGDTGAGCANGFYTGRRPNLRA